jgi:hypothetical protein
VTNATHNTPSTYDFSIFPHFISAGLVEKRAVGSSPEAEKYGDLA